MKPFDIEAARAGAPVCTREGLPVTVLTFDRKHDFQIVVLIHREHEDVVCCYTPEGRNAVSPSCNLRMAPVKKEGWINIYPNNDPGSFIHATKEEAQQSAGTSRITTVKVEWEE